MNNFSFSNKTYDLLLSLKEENIIRDTTKSMYKSVKDIRFMIDFVKSAYPIYANADPNTILSFVEEIFETRIIKSQFEMANHEEEYVPITSIDIKPGKTYRLTSAYTKTVCKKKGNIYKCVEEKEEGYYFYTFPDKEMSLREYNDHFMKIYKNKKPMILKQHIFKYKIGDRVISKYDINMIGSIKERYVGGIWFPQTDPFRIYPNFYKVRWDNGSSYPHFYDENEINDVMKKSKVENSNDDTTFKSNTNKKPPIIVNVKVDGLTKKVRCDTYIDDIKDGVKKRIATVEVFSKKTFDHLMNFYKYTSKEAIEKKVGFVKIDVEIKEPKRRKGKKYSKTKVQRIDEIKKRKVRRETKLLEYKQRPIIQENKKGHTYKYVKKISDGSIERIEITEANRLIKKDDYMICSNKEFREYASKNKKEPIINKIGTISVKTPNSEESTIIPANRNVRRSENKKVRRNSRLVEEQFVPVAIAPQVIKVKSLKPTLKVYEEDKDGNKTEKMVHFTATINKPATVKLKRILVKRPNKKLLKVTKDVILQRKERAIIDRNIYLKNSKKKSLDDLKEQFKEVERRNNKFSSVEKWSDTFTKMVKLILTSKLYREDGKFIGNIDSKYLSSSIFTILSSESKQTWENEKILDFIRYVRLTTHGVFEKEKPEKINKKKKIRHFKPVKFITKIDYTKLTYNKPNENKEIIVNIKIDDGEPIQKNAILTNGNEIWTAKNGEFICSFREVIGWKYVDEDCDFKDPITDNGGGIREVPIKFKEIISEDLKKFFDKLKENQFPFIKDKYKPSGYYLEKKERKKKSEGYKNHINAMYNKWLTKHTERINSKT